MGNMRYYLYITEFIDWRVISLTSIKGYKKDNILTNNKKYYEINYFNYSKLCKYEIQERSFLKKTKNIEIFFQLGIEEYFI